MRRCAFVFFALTLAAAPRAQAGPLESFTRMLGLLEASSLDEAAAIAAGERAQPGMAALLRGVLLHYRGAYAEATRALDEALAPGAIDPRLLPEARELRGLAAATEQVTRGMIARRSEHFEIKVSPG